MFLKGKFVFPKINFRSFIERRQKLKQGPITYPCAADSYYSVQVQCCCSLWLSPGKSRPVPVGSE